MKKRLLFPLVAIMLLAGAWFAGPAAPGISISVDSPVQPLSVSLASLDQFVQEREALYTDIKPDNEARVVWANPEKKEKTGWSIVYLHGFSASQQEGYPVHRQVASYYGCNLYLARLSGHGRQNDSIFMDLTPDSYLQSAKEALAIGKTLGKKVMLMGTSTGGALALYLAAHDPHVQAVVLYSPLIAFYNPAAELLTSHWGLQMGRLLLGSEYLGWEPELQARKKYWSTRYRVEGLVALSKMVEETMRPEVFAQVQCPVFLGYYYKNEEEQDQVVSVAAMRQMFGQLGTASELKKEVAFPEAGDHVIASGLLSRSWQAVRDSTLHFLGHQAGLYPADEVPEALLQNSLPSLQQNM